MAQQFLAEAESAYKTAKALIPVEPKIKDSKVPIYVCSDMETYNLVGNEIGDEKSSYYGVFPSVETEEDGLVCVTYCENPKDLRYTKGLIRHAAIEMYCRRLGLKEPLPAWFFKGFAAKEERFFHPKYISWSKAALIREGGVIKLKQFFDSFNFTAREIFNAGLVFAFMQSDMAPQRVKDKLQGVLKAIKANKKIGNAFAKLEQDMIRSEKEFRKFVDKY